MDTITTNWHTYRRKHHRDIICKAQRIVIKVGSAVLTRENSMDLEVIENLALQISRLHDEGREVVLVSSGAVAAGRKKLNIKDIDKISLKEKQALAAIGQSHLMYIYDKAFEKHHKTIAQILLTHADLSHRKRYVNFKNTLYSLFKLNTIPIINENDTVSTEELQFGDNDNLGALITNLIEGDLFICLTDVDSLYTANPETDPRATAIKTVDMVTKTIEAMAGHSKSSLGTGGMQSKIAAVKKVNTGGGAALIGCGKTPGIIQHLFDGQDIGTFFMPSRKRLSGRKQWIAFVLRPKGQLIVDQGACFALVNNGKSLLPSGIKSVRGSFKMGDAVQCVTSSGTIFAVGLSSHGAQDVKKIQGKNSREIQKILGKDGKCEVIHRDDLVIL